VVPQRLSVVGIGIFYVLFKFLVLDYRCMDFVIQMWATIEMLPFDAARSALGFLQGTENIL